MSYAKYQVKAKEKISKYGGVCTLSRKSDEETYDPDTDSYSSSDVQINGKAIQNDYDVSLINGTSVLEGDIFLMCTFDEEPMNTDKLTFGGKTYTIVSIKPFSPDGETVIYWTIQAR